VSLVSSPRGLVVVCGATATGKSSLAVALAQKYQAVLLSADSRQVYREFDIGTAKPNLAQRQLVPHELIDICEPTENLTVADYQGRAQELIEAYHKRGILPILVGGTGLYIRAIVQGLRIPKVPPQPELRSQLQAYSQSELYQILQKVDAAAAQKINPSDRVRTVRALEVFYTTGQPISAQQGEAPPSYPILQIGLEAAPQVLRERIQQRTRQMVADHWLDEVQQLQAKYGKELPLLQTLGYREMAEHLAGYTSLEEAIARTITHTCQFAKRQRTWFRSDQAIHWFAIDQPDFLTEIEHCLDQFLGS